MATKFGHFADKTGRKWPKIIFEIGSRTYLKTIFEIGSKIDPGICTLDSLWRQLYTLDMSA